jgi:hypothetical protein
MAYNLHKILSLIKVKEKRAGTGWTQSWPGNSPEQAGEHSSQKPGAPAFLAATVTARRLTRTWARAQCCGHGSKKLKPRPGLGARPSRSRSKRPARMRTGPWQTQTFAGLGPAAGLITLRPRLDATDGLNPSRAAARGDSQCWPGGRPP